jgi:hypothetical protein
LEWSLMSLGALVILITFIWDYSRIIIQGRFPKGFFSLATDLNSQSIVTSYVPTSYHWALFILGELLIFSAMVIFVRRMKAIR